MLEDRLEAFFQKLYSKLKEYSFEPYLEEEGTAVSVGDDIVFLKGLPNATLFELVVFEREDTGLIFDLDVETAGVVLLQKGVVLKPR